ncbi:MAG: acyl-CoA desaturase [Myxococcales bacterium]|nr:acyl-CoA desaturase [Myxococcales bacterium]
MELDGLQELRAEFSARGWNRKATLAVALEMLVHATIAISAYVVFLTAEPLWVRILAMAVSTYGSLGVATNTHTWTHGAGSNKRWVNDLFAYLGYPFFLNLSLTYWKYSHIVVHHTSPNVMGVDMDCDFPPFFVSTDRELERSHGAARFYYSKVQRYVFPFVLWVHTYLRQRKSWLYLWRTLRDPDKRKTAHWIDLGAMLAYWVAWVVIPSFFLPFEQVLAASFIRIGALGYPLFAVLAPAHYPHEAGCVSKGDWPKDFLGLQTATSINYETGPIGGFACSGLQYQIEHHLFPKYSHVFYPKMAPFVRRFCEERGFPYRSMGWGEALAKTLMIFSKPKVEAPDLETLRARIDQQGI